MNWRWTRGIVALGALSLAASVGLGCAEERAPINRVQPNALAKAFFVGDNLTDDTDNPAFYANGTILETGYGAPAGGLFTAFYSNDLSIIRWDITEDVLLGRLAYERIEGADGKGAGQEINDGQVIYAFPITKHFDIRRSYNPSTGEELNVVDENTSDRPWYERTYFRVDWAQNLQSDVYDFDTLAMYGFFYDMSWQPLAYYVSDPTHPHAPHFDVADGYFDVTTKSWVSPGMVDLSHLGWGYTELPACWMDGDFAGGQYPSGNCNPHEITIRHSFHKRGDTDFEPEEMDGYKFQAAGSFVKERFGYDREYRMSDDKWHRFLQRYNIWQRSFYYSDPDHMTGAVRCYTPETTPVGGDPERDEDGNGTQDECEAVGWGSKCNVFKQKCTLPYAQREIRPIVTYYTKGSDQRFFHSTMEATREWDLAMRQAIMAGRNAECWRVLNTPDCDWTQPAIHGQMTQMGDALGVMREVDACLKANGTWDVAQCAQRAADELTERGYDPAGVDFHSLYSLATMDHVVTLCHSPIEAGDHPLCAPGRSRLPSSTTAADCHVAWKEGGDKGTRAICNKAYAIRIGDVRHHLVNVIEDPESFSPWGFGPTYADPLTGEAVSASINVWAWPTDYIAQATIDIARFIAGELSVEDVTDGVYVHDWVKAAELASGKGALPPMTRAEFDQRVGNVMRAMTRDLTTGDSADIEYKSGSTTGFSIESDLQKLAQQGEIPEKIIEKFEAMGRIQEVRAAADAPSMMAPKYLARMKQARDTATEAELTTQAMYEFAGTEKLPTEIAMMIASPLRGMTNPTMQRQLRQHREVAMAARGACMLYADDFAPSPTAAMGMAKQLQDKFGNFDATQPLAEQLVRATKMKDWLVDRMHYGVMIHEMGHTYGLRHNFVSSSMAINYRPQYWQLRTENGETTAVCQDLTESEDAARNCVGPRYFDQITQNETDNMIWTFSNSSVMDYGGDYSQDLLGLGAWDYAAARMFYGGATTVFESPDFNEGTGLSGAITETILDNFGGILGYRIHYSSLNSVYDLINNCTDVDPAVFKPSDWDTERLGEWSPLLDGLLVQVNGTHSRCFQQRVAYSRWEDLRRANLSNYREPPAIDLWNRTRVPYGFGTDRWADLGNLSVYRHDMGADAYELFQFFITEQELRHIFDNYRRGRQSFSVRGAANRVLSRYNEKMRDGAKGMGLIKNDLLNPALMDLGDAIPAAMFPAMVDYWNVSNLMLSSGMAFDHFARQLSRPNAGPHIDPRAGLPPQVPGSAVPPPHLVPLRFDTFGNPAVTVPDGPQGFWGSVGIGGKPVNNSLAQDQGEFDSNYTMNAGSYYDKLYTPMLLTESVDNFISDSIEDFTDPRYRSVSMADLMPDGYRRWLANNLTGDDWIKGPRVATTAAGNVQVDSDGYPSQPIGWISWWPDTPQVCFTNTGNAVCTGWDGDGTPFKADAPEFTRPIDPQVSWEQHKFLISSTLVYLPENQKQTWLDMMGIWSIGDDTDPGFPNRIELHAPF
ncbi:MAG: hypothetical protein JRI68_27330, partial [Deltaproteobacteria bacterium]|nr:hypothetical protein [Deltaproteobacteria bacterium]